MSPSCNKPNPRRMNAFASRIARLPQYSQVEIFGREMALEEPIPPEMYSSPNIIALTVPLLPLYSESEELRIQKRIEEMYALHLDKLISSNLMASSADPMYAEQRLWQIRATVVKRSQCDELVFSASVLQVLTQTLTGIHKTFLHEYQMLRSMCLVQPSLDSSKIVEQLKVIDNNAVQMKAAKRGLQAEHRRLENQLRKNDMQLNPLPESLEIQKVRTTCRNVSQLLNLYSQV